MVCVSRCSLKSVDMSAIALGLGDMSNIAPSPSVYPDITSPSGDILYISKKDALVYFE